MTTNDALTQIHVAVAPSEASLFASSVRERGFSAIPVDLTGVNDRSELCKRLGEAFLFPYTTTSMDAVIDLLSDLEWLGHPAGYVVSIDGCDDVGSDVLRDTVGMLPAIVDRWRTQHHGFVILLLGSSHRDLALTELNIANEELRARAELAWVQDTGPVEVIDHSEQQRIHRGDEAPRG